MAWIYLVFAGLLEVCWAIGLKFTDGFTRPASSLFVAAALAGSMFFLALAVRTLPIGTAYAIWVGIGALGAVIFGAVFFQEQLTLARGFFVVLLVVAILGLKVTSPAGN